MKTIFAVILTLATGVASAAPTPAAIQALKVTDAQHKEAAETGTNSISAEAAYKVEEAPKALDAHLKPATAKVVQSKEFRSVMQAHDASEMLVGMP